METVSIRGWAKYRVALIGAAAIVGCTSPADPPDASDHVMAQSTPLSPPAVSVGTVQMPPGGGNLSLAIYDATGQLVRTLAAATPTAAGTVSVAWDGQDDFHNTLPAGTYSWKALASQASAVDEGSIGQGSANTSDETVYSSGAQAVAVDPSENVYEGSNWEEFHQELRSWTSAGQRRWGGSTGYVGAALAADGNYVYVAQATGVENHILRFSASLASNARPFAVPWSGQPVTGYILANASGGHGVFGLAVDASTLWVSNHTKNRVQRFDKVSGSALGEITVLDPHGLAADGSGNVWVTNGTDRVTLFGPTGNVLTQISGLSQPFAAAIGGPANHLYVGEAATGTVKELVPTTGALVRTLFGRAMPGPVHDDRLRWPDTVDPGCAANHCVSGPGGGLAVDPTGRIIVADPGNQRVQVYNPDGTLALSRFNGYANQAQVDAALPNLVLSGGLEYSVDYAAGPSHGAWQLANNWRPSGLDVGDVFSGAGSHRKLSNGREYIYWFVGPSIAIFQIATDGQSARKSAVIGNGPTGLYNAADGNANGTIDAGEIIAKAGTASYQTLSPGLWVDAAGNVFMAAGPGGALLKLQLKGFDAHANPLYDWADVTQQPPLIAADSTFWHFAPTNVRVDPVTGDIFRIGTTSQANQSAFWMGGTTVERRIASGSRFLFVIPQSTPDPTFTAVPGVGAIATDTDGNYFYTGQSGVLSGGGGQVWVRMFTVDGLLVTHGGVGPADGGQSGWIDGGFGLTAFTHAGTHYVYTEDSYFGRSVRFRIDALATLQRLNDATTGTTFTWTPASGPQIVEVNATTADTVEGTTSSPGVFTFTRSDSRGDLTVSFSTAGTATSATDYGPLPATVLIPNGSFTAKVVVQPSVDTSTEGNETVVVSVAAGPGYASGTPSSASVTIHDQTLVNVSAAPSTINVAGPNATATYTLSRSNTDLALVANYRLGAPRIPIVSASPSTAYPNSSASASYDGKTSSNWMTFGNSDHEGHDDQPAITYTFDAIYPLGVLRISNFNGGEAGRGAKEVDVLISMDGVSFTLLGTRQFQAGVASGSALWQEIDLAGASAKAVKFAIKSNWYGRVFYQGTSYEGAFANASITGLSEVEFHALGASPTDIAPIVGNTVQGHFSFGSVAFAAGQASAVVSISPIDAHLVNQPPKALELRLADTGTFTLGASPTASVTLINDRVGPVVAVTAANGTAVRGGAPGIFRFTRTGDTSAALTVSYTTATVPIPTTASGSSSSYASALPSLSYDGRPETVWMTSGNSDHEGHDDTPWVTYSFDHLQTIGRLRVSNYNGGEHLRGAKNVDVLVSTDGVSFTSLGTKQFQVGSADAANSKWQDLELGSVPALVIKLSILSNWYGRTFYQGTSYEGSFANASITGLSEVKLFTGSTAPASDFASGTLTGTVVIPAGQTSVDLSIPALTTAGLGDTLTLTATSDNSVYSIGTPSSATVTVADRVLATPVAIVSSTASSYYNGGTTPAKSYDEALATFWMSAGNSDHEGHDDTPWIQYTFDKAYLLGWLRVSNYNTGEYLRGAKDVDVLVSTDGSNFTSIGTKQFQLGSSTAAGATWQDIDLGGVRALAVKLAVRSNWYGRTFYQGSSYDGAWANPSITGISEVQFYAALPIVSSSASSSYAAWVPTSNSYDGSLTTLWMTAGNSDHEGHDDTPWIQYTFDAPHSLGTLRVSNYNTGEYLRGAKDVDVQISMDGSQFASIGLRQFQVGSSTSANTAWQDIDLGGIPALAVKLAIHTNWYGRTFYQGTSYDGAFANPSIAGLSEVQFFAPHP